MTAALAPMEVPARLERLRNELESRGLERFLVSDTVNVRYLTGFTGSSARLCVDRDRAVLLTDGRYRDQAESELTAAALADDVGVFVGGPTAQIEHAAGFFGGGSVGLEADAVTWSEHGVLSGALAPGDVVATSGVVETLRRSKDPGEIARIEAAAQIADAALHEVRPLLLEQPTEREFAIELDHAMLRAGAAARSFETICASGPNGALPHARPGERTIRSGDLVVLDFGAVVDGYHSDMTRTLGVGDLPEPARQQFDVVAAAQRLGVATVGPGVSCAHVDAACREHITAAGMGDLFVHGTGHGVGLVIHEAPWVNASSEDVLQPGQVVTVEPGVYRPGFGGVRVEDTVVVTPEGARRLTASPYEPVVA